MTKSCTSAACAEDPDVDSGERLENGRLRRPNECNGHGDNEANGKRNEGERNRHADPGNEKLSEGVRQYLNNALVHDVLGLGAAHNRDCPLGEYTAVFSGLGGELAGSV